MHVAGEKIAMLTCYDASFERVLDDAGVGCLLLGASLAWFCRDRRAPYPSRSRIAYHVCCVARGNSTVRVIERLAVRELPGTGASQRVGADAGRRAHGQGGSGGWTNETIRFMAERGIPSAVT